MIEPAIEKEIVIDAPVDVVWRMVTEPQHIVHWFSYRAEFEARPGARGVLTFQDGGEVQMQIEALEPPRRFAFRWVHRPGAVARAGNSTLVEFILQAEAGRTRLRVVESGFDQIDWSDEDKVKAVEDHDRGWEFCLGRLRDYIAEER